MRIERIERRRGPSRRARIVLVAVAVALLVLLLSLRGIAGFYTDYLWFDSLGASSVFSGMLAARFFPALVFTSVFFVILLANLVIADRLAPRFVPAGPEEEFVQRYREVIAPYAGRVRVGVALLFALIAGGGVSAHWHEWILFRNRVDFGVRDPQFDTDVGFYVFQLPFLKFLFEWTFAALIIVFLVTAVAHYLNGGIRVRSPFEKVTAAVRAHLSVLLAVIALVRAAGYWLERYELTSSTRGAVHGASYTDINAKLPAIYMLILISFVAAGLFLYNIFRRGWVLPALGVGLWAFVSLIIGQIYPAALQRFSVEPNEFSREQEYIERNIEATRDAYGIDEVALTRFDYRENLTPKTLRREEGVVDNARLWDPDVLPKTYSQLQRFRNYYSFPDVDIDRYVVDGKPVQTLLAGRELDHSQLPNQSWVNRHLQFTHGYGLVMSPASESTPDGRPRFLVEGIPPQSEAKELRIDRPQLYFGESFDTYALVKTKEREFDFPREDSEEDVTTTYEGDGGVRLSGFFRRAAFALRFADLRFFASSELTPETRVLFERNVLDRVKKVAPFLKFDADPYPVIVDGRVVYMVDAFTVTDNYPYAQATVPEFVKAGSGLRGRMNYVRNSVKAVVDAYDGTVTFYVVDDDDPMAAAYRKAFPDLFADFDEMPDGLRAHLRYPEDLFRVQSELFATYHVDDARQFYNRSDQWAIASDPGSGDFDPDSAGTGAPIVETTGTTQVAGGNPLSAVEDSSRRRMEPYYLLMRLPGAKQEEFVMLQPYSPAGTRGLGTLLSFMVAKSDPGDYGDLHAYVMPTGDDAVEGPTQVDNVIHTTPDISERVSLLGRTGSRIVQGTMQLIPVGNSLLYVRPLYVQAEGEAQFPELRFVIVYYAGRAVMDTSLDGALDRLFREGSSAVDEGDERAAPGRDEPERRPAPAGDVLEELQERFEGLEDDLGEIGDLIGRLREEDGSPSGTTTTTAAAAAEGEA